MTDRNTDILRLSAQIVAAHAEHNYVERHAISGMIHSVYNTLWHLSTDDTRPSVALASKMQQLAEVDHHQSRDGHSNANSHGRYEENAYMHPVHGQTVFEDRLVCMEDGLSMKMLKRHLLTVHGMTPDEYRAKWHLPESYPMVASQYARLRSSLAVQSGLGLKPQGRLAKSRR